jgi:hypothetical protein
MANYELVALVEGTPQLRAPTASDSASLAGSLAVTGSIRVTGTTTSSINLLAANGNGSFVYWGEAAAGDRGVLGFAAGTSTLQYRSAADGLASGTQRFSVSTSAFDFTSLNITTTGTIRPGGYTVATLPAGTIGMKAYVTDALAPAFLTLLVGGGAAYSGAQFNGTNWVGD